MKQNKKCIAFFDFCETLVSFQTADAFVDYVRNNTQYGRMLRWNKIQSYLYKLKIIPLIELITKYRFSINKRLKLYQLKGLSVEELNNWAEKYYLEYLKPNFIKIILDKLIELQKEGYEIVVVSGGYDAYLKFFIDEFNLQGLFCTKIDCDKKKCKGTISGLDCLNDNKIILLEKNYKIIDYYSIAYSDSKTDLPLLKWVNNGYVVSRNNSQSWAKINKLNEIIWDEKNN